MARISGKKTAGGLVQPKVKMKIRKGDKVIVLTGRDKGQTGDVLKAIPSESRVIVRGVNMVKKHQAPTRGNQGGIINKEAPIHVSNVALVDPETGKATRVAYKILEDGTKVRVARQSGEVIRDPKV